MKTVKWGFPGVKACTATQRQWPRDSVRDPAASRKTSAHFFPSGQSGPSSISHNFSSWCGLSVEVHYFACDILSFQQHCDFDL